MRVITTRERNRFFAVDVRPRRVLRVLKIFECELYRPKLKVMSTLSDVVIQTGFNAYSMVPLRQRSRPRARRSRLHMLRRFSQSSLMVVVL